MNFLRKFWKAAARKKTIGELGEAAAAKFLKKNGYRILERNFRSHPHEIDIIAWNRNEKALVFVEVKTRNAEALVGGYHAAMNKHKRDCVKKCAAAYLKKTKFNPVSWRFDIIEAAHNNDGEISAISHFENITF